MLKKGWLHKKSLMGYKAKYALFSADPKPNLQIYESRDAQRPKYQIYTDSISVTIPSSSTSTLGGLFASFLPVTSAPIYEFIVETRSRKFIFKAESAKERDEWVDILREFSRVSRLDSQMLQNIDNQDDYDLFDDGRSVVSFKSQWTASASNYGSVRRGMMPRSKSQVSIGSRSTARSSLWHGEGEDEELECRFLMASSGEVKQSMPENLPFLSAVLDRSCVDALLQSPLSAINGGVDKTVKRDWNEMYQRSNNILDKARVIGEFRSAVQDILVNIVNSSLSIPQVFQHASILFHDVGGKKGNLELQAINSVIAHADAKGMDVCTPLVCCVEYRGVAVIACPMLPLGDHTRKSDPSLRDMLSQFGRADEVEVHRVDGRVYVVNLHNLLHRDESWRDPSARYRPEITTQRTDEKSLRKRLDASISLFCSRCDLLELTPMDSRGLTAQMHKHGINMRYLGKICKLTQVPYIQDQLKIEMVARAVKHLMREKIAKTIERYKSIEATNIDNDLRAVLLKLLNCTLCDPSRIFGQLAASVKTKYAYELSLVELQSLHKPALLLAMKHQCGLDLHISVSNFSLPLEKHQFAGFEPKSTVPQLPLNLSSCADNIERQCMSLAKQMLYLGQSRFERNEVTAMKMMNLSRSYYDGQQYATADLFSKLAYRFSPLYHPARNIIQSSFIETSKSMQSQNDVFELFSLSYKGVTFHLGEDHPILMTLYDKMVMKMSELHMDEEALEILGKSMTLSIKILGNAHPTSAGYKTKIGYMLMSLHKYKEALGTFKEAMALFKSMPYKTMSIREAISENLYCMAECLYEGGSIEDAIAASLESKQIRDQIHETMHPKTIDSYQQYAKLLSVTFADYVGVLTDGMRKNLFTAITCYEKVFRFMKSSNAGTDLLLELTRTLVGLKVRSLSGEMKEIVRTIKSRNQVFDERMMRETIVKLVHLTPTVYLEEIFQRISDGDERAVVELGAILQVAESSKISTKK